MNYPLPHIFDLYLLVKNKTLEVVKMNLFTQAFFLGAEMAYDGKHQVYVYLLLLFFYYYQCKH